MRHPCVRSKRRLLALAMAVTIVVTCGLTAGAAGAETLSNAGKEFWLGFPTNCGECGGAQQSLYLTGSTATTGTVSVPGEAFSEAFSVTPGKVTRVVLPSGTEMSGAATNGSEEKAVHVTAGAPVVVYGLNDFEFTTDAYTGLPTAVDGTSYTVLAYGSGAGGNSVFSVVATQDDTKVTITPSVSGGAEGERAAGVPYTIELSRGQEYQLVATTNPDDLTGTKITSSAPVSVYGGQECANIPTEEYTACDYVVEQNTPEDAWGTSFLSVPLKTRSHGDLFQLVADQNETHVKLNGALVATLAAGQHYSQEVEGSAEWTSDKAIQLAQYSNSSSYDETTGDPFMITIPPYQQFETEYTITTPEGSTTSFENYVNIVAPASAVGTIKIDGTAVPAAEFSPIGSSGFDGAEVDLPSGSHVVTGNGQPFGVFSYGFSAYNGYGYPGGLSLAPVATVAKVTLAPATETAPVGSERCVTATVTDQEEHAVPGVRVDFEVTGANSAKGSVFANEAGEAKFCYTGTKAGEDKITGAVGLVSGTAHKQWTEGPPPPPTSLTTSLSGGGQSGPKITVNEGASATDQATLSGTNAGTATGTVSYSVYSDLECTKLVASAGSRPVTGGTVTASNAETLAPGTYYWQAVYSGDAENAGSSSECGTEVEKVEHEAPPAECTASGSGRFRVKREIQTLTDKLSTNLTGKESLKFKWNKEGKHELVLTSLTAASCSVKKHTTTFGGAGIASLNGVEGYKVSFKIGVTDRKKLVLILKYSRGHEHMSFHDAAAANEVIAPS